MFERIDSILDPNDTTYLHSNLQIVSGCYKVTGVDSVGNETINALAVCVDTCRQYVLPSVFTLMEMVSTIFFTHAIALLRLIIRKQIVLHIKMLRVLK